MSDAATPLPFVPEGKRFDRFARAQFLELVAQGHGRTAAAKRIGFHRNTITNRMHRDPEFAAAVLNAEGEILDDIESVMYHRARAGHVEAAKFVLERRDPMRWGPLSARRAIGPEEREPSVEELSETAVTLIRQIIEKETRVREADVIDVESEEVSADDVDRVPPVPAALPGQTELGEVDWDAELGDHHQ